MPEAPEVKPTYEAASVLAGHPASRIDERLFPDVLLPLALAALGCMFAYANWSILIAYYWKGKRSSSIPLIGGTLLCIAIWLPPWRHSHFWWAGLLIDAGCIPLLAEALIHAVRRRPRR